jgi:hypothetical protein
LRAFTPRDQRAVKAAAETFRQNPAFDTQKAITELGVGEALVSMLEGKGTPAMVTRDLIAPPSSRVGPITADERASVMKKSPVLGKYDTTIDSESAYEVLAKRASGGDAPAPTGESGGGFMGTFGSVLGSLFGGGGNGEGRQRMSTGEMIIRSAAQSAARSVGTQITRAILRNVLGGLTKR